MKVTTSIPFVFTSHMQALILYYVAKNETFRMKITYSCEIHITPNNIVLKCDDEETKITCVQEWITVMYVLNTMASKTKYLVLEILEKYPEKLLLMIDVILMMGHCDIIFIMLMMIFELVQNGHTYEVFTYANKNDNIEPLLCYSKLCGFEYNPHNMSTCLIKYFDDTYNVSSYEKEIVRAKEICGSDWLIDPVRRLYLIQILTFKKIIVVGKVENSKVSIFAYLFNRVLWALKSDEACITSTLESLCAEHSVFYKVHMKGSNIEHVQIHHNIVDSVLC